MKSKWTNAWIIALGLGLGLTACPNPADKAPKAKVEAQGALKPAAGDPAKPPEGPSTQKGTAEKLAIDTASSKISFVGSKVTGKHDGGFKAFSGSLFLNPEDLTASTLEIEIDVASMWTDAEKLTGHLKTADFFDVEKHPKATFKVSKVVKGGEGGASHTLSGDLTMHGVTKAINFPATITISETEVSAKSEFSINRKDFGLVYPGKPDDLIRDDVLIKLDIKAPRKKK